MGVRPGRARRRRAREVALVIGHGRRPLRIRAEALVRRPDLWRDWPADVVPAAPGSVYASSWNAIVDYLKALELVSPTTLPQDVNVDRIVRAAKLLVDTN